MLFGPLNFNLKRRVLLLWLLVIPLTATAHRLDEYLQATLVSIEPGHIQLQIHLTPGVQVADTVLRLLDLNQDGRIAAEEADAYADLVKSALSLKLDGRKLPLTLQAVECSEIATLRDGLGAIQIELSAKFGSLAAGAHQLTFENRHQTKRSVFLVNALLPRSKQIVIGRQERNENQSRATIHFTYTGMIPLRTGEKRIGVQTASLKFFTHSH
jgi:hypothetical protein